MKYLPVSSRLKTALRTLVHRDAGAGQLALIASKFQICLQVTRQLRDLV